MKRLYPIALSLILLSICSQTTLTAQEELKPGFVVTLEGDTLHGYASAKNDKRFGVLCNFGISTESKVIVYNPSEIKAFRILNGKFYVSREVILGEKPQLVFLEYLINGKANIYYLRSFEDHYFIEKDDKRLVELTEPVNIIQTDSGKFIVPPRFKGKLTYLLADGKGMENQINHTTLDHQSLIILAKNYHEKVCRDTSCLIYEKEIKKIQVIGSISGGPIFTNIGFGHMLRSTYGPGLAMAGRMELLNASYSSSSLTYQIDFILQRFIKAGIHNQENYEGIEMIDYDGKRYYVNKDTTFDFINNYNKVQELNVDLKVTALKIPVSLNYYFGNQRIQPFLGGGLSGTFVLTQNKQLDYYKYSSYFGKTIPLFFAGIQGKTGIRYKPAGKRFVYITFAYDYSSSLNLNEDLRSKLQTISCLAGYSF